MLSTLNWRILEGHQNEYFSLSPAPFSPLRQTIQNRILFSQRWVTEKRIPSPPQPDTKPVKITITFPCLSALELLIKKISDLLYLIVDHKTLIPEGAWPSTWEDWMSQREGKKNMNREALPHFLSYCVTIRLYPFVPSTISTQLVIFYIKSKHKNGLFPEYFFWRLPYHIKLLLNEVVMSYLANLSFDKLFLLFIQLQTPFI